MGMTMGERVALRETATFRAAVDEALAAPDMVEEFARIHRVPVEELRDAIDGDSVF